MTVLDWMLGREKAERSTPPSNWYTQARQLVDGFGVNDADTLAQLAQDHCGYMRQAAMERAIQLQVPNLLPLLATRLNDHVSTIGHLARSAMLDHVGAAPVADLIAVLPAILRLRSASRSDHSAWLARIEVAYCERIDIDLLQQAVFQPDRAVGRACMDLLRSRDAIDIVFLRAVLQRSADLVILQSAFELVLRLPPQLRDGLCWVAGESKPGKIRAQAMPVILAGAPDADKDARASRALLDSQARVREAARDYLRPRGVDLVAYYRNVLDDASVVSKQRAIALYGLESLRATSELAFIRQLPFDSPMLRRTALRVWIKLAPEEKDEVALAALGDRAVSVRRFAYTAVMRHGAYIPSSVIAATLRGTENAALYRLFAVQNRWDWLIYLAVSALDAQPGSAAWTALRSDLTQWASWSAQYDRITADQKQALGKPGLQEALERLAGESSGLWPALAEQLAKLELRASS